MKAHLPQDWFKSEAGVVRSITTCSTDRRYVRGETKILNLLGFQCLFRYTKPIESLQACNLVGLYRYARGYVHRYLMERQLRRLAFSVLLVYQKCSRCYAGKVEEDMDTGSEFAVIHHTRNDSRISACPPMFLICSICS